MRASLFRSLILGFVPAIFCFGCTRATEPTFSNTISSQANLTAVSPALKQLEAQWNPEQREGTTWPIVEMAFENSVVPFQHSSQRLALDLLLNTPESLDSLKFARTLSPEYKSKSLTVLELATQVGMDAWGRDLFDSILQTKPSLERLNSYQKTLSAGLVFTAQEQRRTSSSIQSGNQDAVLQRQDEARIDLITRALNEKWQTEQFEDLEVILGIARLEHVCGKLPTRSLMVKCLGPARFSKAENGFFAPTFGRRYQELAKETIAGSMTTHDPSGINTSLGEALFSSTNLLWARCEADQFTIKRALLRGSLHALNDESDEIHRSVMERQIRDVLRDCTVSNSIASAQTNSANQLSFPAQSTTTTLIPSQLSLSNRMSDASSVSAPTTLIR